MKLGTETGSLMNYMMDGGLRHTIGTGATILFWTDRYAGTIIKITAKQIHVQEDTITRTDSNGMSESQSYDYAPNPNGKVHVFRLNKRGRYRSPQGCGLCIGERDQYHDFSF